MNGDADDEHEHERDDRPRDRGHVVRRARAEAHDDEHDFEALQQDALEGHRERVPVEAETLLAGGAPRGGRLGGERFVLVVQRDIPGAAEDGLPQPLQAEGEQEGAHHQLQPLPRDVLREARADDRDGRAEDDQRHYGSPQARTPAARDAEREDDRERLDELDRRCQKRGRRSAETGEAHRVGVGR